MTGEPQAEILSYAEYRYVKPESPDAESFRQLFYQKDCAMCGGSLRYYPEDLHTGGWQWHQFLNACIKCGWWQYGYDSVDNVEGEEDRHDQLLAQLKVFAVSDPEVPLSLLMSHLKRHPASLSDIHHRKFEETIAAIYRDVYGYRVELTKQTRDNGVDIYLFDANGHAAAVEVKQKRDPRRPVGISALQRLAGAAFPRGIDEVHLVTNGRISSDCHKEAELYDAQPMKVSLVDFRAIASALDLYPSPEIRALVGSPQACPVWRQNFGNG